MKLLEKKELYRYYSYIVIKAGIIMDDLFKIYVEQLRDGHIEEIDEKYDPAFIDVNEKELTFQEPVHVRGQAYLADNTLVLHFAITAQAIMPCSVCNDLVKVPIKIKDFYHAEPLAEIKSGIFNFKKILRETVLLETPRFAECEGKCPHRTEIARYLKQTEQKAQSKEDEDGYQPFANLNWDDKTKK